MGTGAVVFVSRADVDSLRGHVDFGKQRRCQMHLEAGYNARPAQLRLSLGQGWNMPPSFPLGAIRANQSLLHHCSLTHA
jgi:hypothetical protein